MNHSLTLRALARLLSYPDAAFVQQLPLLREVVQGADLGPETCRAVTALVDRLQRSDWLETEALYVDSFDRGRRTSLHLFEHVHGDSRDRGPAMLDLQKMYADAGLYLADGELPDFLPVVLEYASTQPAELAQGFLGEMAHILNALHTALTERRNPYAAVVAAVLEIAGEPIETVALAEEAPLDEAWAEPEVFGGCNSKGQQSPAQPQPIQIVRAPKPAQQLPVGVAQ